MFEVKVQLDDSRKRTAYLSVTSNGYQWHSIPIYSQTELDAIVNALCVFGNDENNALPVGEENPQ